MTKLLLFLSSLLFISISSVYSELISISECFIDSVNNTNIDEFVIFDNEVTFEEAETLCVEQGSGTLARVSSENEFNLVNSFINEFFVAEIHFWIGLRRDSNLEEVEALDPNSFVFVDGKGNSDFYENRTNFPWGADQPNNQVGNQACVRYERSGSRRWDDFECDNTFKVLCRRPCNSTTTVSLPPTNTGSEAKDLTPLIAAFFFLLLVSFGVLFSFRQNKSFKKRIDLLDS